MLPADDCSMTRPDVDFKGKSTQSKACHLDLCGLSS
jgi:hypothetical protein